MSTPLPTVLSQSPGEQVLATRSPWLNPTQFDRPSYLQFSVFFFDRGAQQSLDAGSAAGSATPGFQAGLLAVS